MSPTVAARYGSHTLECSKGHNTYCLSFRSLFSLRPPSRKVFLNRRAAARYRALASIIPGREKFPWNLSF